MKQNEISDPRSLEYASFALAQITLTILVAKGIIPREEAKEWLLRVSFSMDAKSAAANNSKNKQQAATFKEVKDIIMAVLENLDSLPENPKSA